MKVTQALYSYLSFNEEGMHIFYLCIILSYSYWAYLNGRNDPTVLSIRIKSLSNERERVFRDRTDPLEFYDDLE